MKYGKKHFRNNFLHKGFTLIELTIVFTIIAAISGIGFASYSAFSSRQTLDQTAYDLKDGIDQAKQTAISRVKPSGCGASTALEGYKITICAVTNTTNPCVLGTNLYEISPICTPAPNPTPAIVSKVRNSKIGMSLESCTNPLTYLSQTGYMSGPCEVTLLNSENNIEKKVCVDAGGNVSVKDGGSSC